MAKPLAPKMVSSGFTGRCPSCASWRVVARSGISFGGTRGTELQHRQPLQLTRPQSYFAPLTSALAHFRVMIVRNTKRKVTAAPAPTASAFIGTSLCSEWGHDWRLWQVVWRVLLVEAR